jgi:hypothetical protein
MGAVDGMFICEISHQVSKTESSGVDEQFLPLEMKCHSGCNEPKDVALDGRFIDVETFHPGTGNFIP